MGENFFINIDCSEVLQNCGEAQYKMFIDTTKMSIVYELTEWIRWMFSLEHCFYLMHENSVIHELEDIQFLSSLKNFEIRPCGQPNCVHKKTYRALLDNLNLFVSWNNVKVHKYFLNKLTKIDKAFNQESDVGSCSLNSASKDSKVQGNSISHKAKTDYNKFFSNNKPADFSLGGTPLTKQQVLIDNYISKPENNYGFLSDMSCNGIISQNVSVYSTENFNTVNDLNNSENKKVMLGFEKTDKTVINHSSPINNDLAVEAANKKFIKLSGTNKSSQKRVRPFSLGELLSNMREDFKKQNVNETNNTPTPSQNSAVEEENFAFNSDSFSTEDNITGGRKRPRTRRRKRCKKQTPEVDKQISPFQISVLNASNVRSSFSFPKTSKPSHIRFDFNNDELMNTECLGNELEGGKENGFQTNEEVKDTSSTFLQTEPENFIPAIGDKNEGLTDQVENGFPINNTGNNMECCPEDVAQTENVGKLIDVDDEMGENGHQSCSAPELSKPFNHDVQLLLKLKERFKNAVVVERFY